MYAEEKYSLFDVCDFSPEKLVSTCTHKHKQTNTIKDWAGLHTQLQSPYITDYADLVMVFKGLFLQKSFGPQGLSACLMVRVVYNSKKKIHVLSYAFIQYLENIDRFGWFSDLWINWLIDLSFTD